MKTYLRAILYSVHESIHTGHKRPGSITKTLDSQDLLKRDFTELGLVLDNHYSEWISGDQSLNALSFFGCLVN